MKKTYIFIVMLLFLCLYGCAANKVTGVSVANLPEEVVIGNFDGANIQLELSWTDSSTTRMFVKESSLPESEKAKLNTPGVVTISYIYEGFEVSFDIKLVVHSSNKAEMYHNYVVISEVLPTCTTDGQQELLCDCGVSSTRKVKALGHNFGEEEVITEPTCTEDGLNQKACLRDGCGYVENIKVDKIDHEAGEWIIDTEADCVNKGKKHTECTMCHKVMSNQDIPALKHDYSEWVVLSNATCTSTGLQERYCLRELCRFEEQQTIKMTKHTQGEEYVYLAPTCIEHGVNRINCLECNGVLKEIDVPVIPHSDENNDHYCDYCKELLFNGEPFYLATEGKYVLGMYPQHKVTNQVLIDALTSLAGVAPSATKPGSWIGYGYADLVKEEQMWYKDIVLDNFKYRAVYFTGYRADHTDKASTDVNSFQDNNGYYINNIYFFRYDPIKWNLLNQNGNSYTIIADIAIDTLEFNYTTLGHSNSDKIYSNNYEYSTIREFLNNEFYNLAFNDIAKEYIKTSLVKNSSDNIYSSNDTNDNVYILSSAEFSMYHSVLTKIGASDYSKALGCEYSSGCAFSLRSPYLENSTGSMYVGTDGVVKFDYVNRSSLGVVPVITIVLE